MLVSDWLLLLIGVTCHMSRHLSSACACPIGRQLGNYPETGYGNEQARFWACCQLPANCAAPSYGGTSFRNNGQRECVRDWRSDREPHAATCKTAVEKGETEDMIILPCGTQLRD